MLNAVTTRLNARLRFGYMYRREREKNKQLVLILEKYKNVLRIPWEGKSKNQSEVEDKVA